MHYELIQFIASNQATSNIIPEFLAGQLVAIIHGVLFGDWNFSIGEVN